MFKSNPRGNKALFCGHPRIGIKPDADKPVSYTHLYFEGRYTKRLAVVTGAADLLSFLCLFLFLKTPGLVNPQVLPAVNSVFKADERWIGEFISGFPDVFIWVMICLLYTSRCV